MVYEYGVGVEARMQDLDGHRQRAAFGARTEALLAALIEQADLAVVEPAELRAQQAPPQGGDQPGRGSFGQLELGWNKA